MYGICQLLFQPFLVRFDFPPGLLSYLFVVFCAELLKLFLFHIHFLADFGRLFQSPSEGRARARGASKKINVQIVCSEVEKRKVNNFVKLHPTYNVFLSI